MSDTWLSLVPGYRRSETVNLEVRLFRLAIDLGLLEYLLLVLLIIELWLGLILLILVADLNLEGTACSWLGKFLMLELLILRLTKFWDRDSYYGSYTSNCYKDSFAYFYMTIELFFVSLGTIMLSYPSLIWISPLDRSIILISVLTVLTGSGRVSSMFLAFTVGLGERSSSPR